MADTRCTVSEIRGECFTKKLQMNNFNFFYINVARERLPVLAGLYFNWS